MPWKWIKILKILWLSVVMNQFMIAWRFSSNYLSSSNAGFEERTSEQQHFPTLLGNQFYAMKNHYVKRSCKWRMFQALKLVGGLISHQEWHNSNREGMSCVWDHMQYEILKVELYQIHLSIQQETNLRM